MNLKLLDIGFESIGFFQKESNADFQKINQLLKEQCGIIHFFESKDDYFQLKQKMETSQSVICESQIEIQEKYLWQLKFELLEYFLKNPTANKPEIYLYHNNIFNFDFQQIKKQINSRELLVIGNPPWVTNTTLSTLNSNNLPTKSNFKKAKGIDAITGKGNFDIGEYISLKMLDLFSAAVDASLLVCKFNSTPEFTAQEFDFYTAKPKVTMGWVNNKFASDTEKYKKYQHFDGVCPYEWRQGIKHDCSKVMELERIEGGFRNALGEEFELEEDLVYGILKSSDLKADSIDTSRKYTIVTQKKIGQETKDILDKLPKTREYLERHKDYFLQRKSSIYNGKPMYSIFGVGDYSFKPYKVAISGLYKQTKFTLVKPNGTVLLLDDTCYFIGFDTLEEAETVQFELNKPEMQKFIESFMFTDAKRAITKDLLMRIDFDTSIAKKWKNVSLFD